MSTSLADIVAEFRRQRAADPATADRSLLDRGRKLLQEHLQAACLEPDIVRPGQVLLFRLGEYGAVADLLSRYLAQPLSVSEEAWARWHHIDALALCGRCEEMVARHREFLAWTREVFPTYPPALSCDSPFEPIGAAPGPTLPRESLLLWVMGDGTQALCWKDLGLADEWLRIFHDILVSTPRTSDNRFRRFNYLRTAVVIAAMTGKPDDALRVVGDVAALADEEDSLQEARRWRIEARLLEMRVHQETGRMEEVRRVGSTVATLVQEYDRERLPDGGAARKRSRSFRHSAGSCFHRAGQYDLAIPLLRQVIDAGTPASWPYLWLAASLWVTGADRDEVLPLLEEAAYRHRGPLWDDFRKQPGFAGVADDPEFRAAVGVGDRSPNARG